VLYISPHEHVDVAILQVNNVGDDGVAQLPQALKLAGGDAGVVRRTPVAVIGYPADDPTRNSPQDIGRIFSSLEVKNIAPGEVMDVRGDTFFTHDCSTLGGCSGSPVITLDRSSSGCVVGLHYGGRYLEANYAVSCSSLRRIVAAATDDA